MRLSHFAPSSSLLVTVRHVRPPSISVDGKLRPIATAIGYVLEQLAVIAMPLRAQLTLEHWIGFD